MAKSLKVLLDDVGVLKKILGDDPWEFDLQGYYLKCDWAARDALYIPDCLVAIEAFREEDDYFNCDRPSILMGSEEFGIDGEINIEDVDYQVERELMLPDGIKNFFKDKTFDRYYTSLAVQLLLHVRKELKNS